MCTPSRTRVAVRAGRHEHRVHLAIGAVLVVAAQVASIGGRLVEICLLGLRLALQLEHDDGAADQQDYVGAPRLERELVLEDGGVLVGEFIDLNDRADLDLDARD
jgi:ferric-dicitrate binding protein FerR (iron transport regulator)